MKKQEIENMIDKAFKTKLSKETAPNPVMKFAPNAPETTQDRVFKDLYGNLWDLLQPC